MTAPTHYNGKPIPSGTWLANAARVAAVEGEAEKSMTAPTPEGWMAGINFLERLVISDSHRSDRAQALLDGIAAVTADRDGYVFLLRKTDDELHASKQMHEQARSLLDQTLTERDKLREQLADAENRIAEMELDDTLREEEGRWAGL